MHQHPSGGWGAAPAVTDSDLLHESSTSEQLAGESPAAGRSTAAETAFAIDAFVATGKAHHPAARRAVQFLTDTQQDDGSWGGPPFLIRDAATGRWCGNGLHAVSYPLLALSRWAAVAAARDDTGESTTLRLVSPSAAS